MFLSMFVMNAIMEVSRLDFLSFCSQFTELSLIYRVDVLYVVLQVFLMPIIVVSVHCKRKM